MSKRGTSYLIDTIYLCIVILIASIMKPFLKEDIYLIGERKNQCQDNGYHLFKYVRTKHPEEKFFYVIEKDAMQLEKIKQFGNIIYYKSFKHYLYYFLARKLVCAHVASCTPDDPIIWKLEEKKIIQKNRVFIQHGIIKELIPSLMFNNSRISTFICGAKSEYDFVKDNFNYPENAVHYLGLCRFDDLHDIKTKKQILLMPTWRQWFGMNDSSKMSIEEFLESKYFLTYNNLINNDKLVELIEVLDYEFIFYLHHEMQPYRHCFFTNSKNIKIAIDKDYDVQELLKESEILITDYSSIAFDFAYMRKPLIYFQFDSTEYYEKHYQKGYFDYEKIGFGKVVYNTEELVMSLSEIIISGNNDCYINRSSKFFPLYDKNNCMRTYLEILS